MFKDKEHSKFIEFNLSINMREYGGQIKIALKAWAFSLIFLHPFLIKSTHKIFSKWHEKILNKSTPPQTKKKKPIRKNLTLKNYYRHFIKSVSKSL